MARALIDTETGEKVADDVASYRTARQQEAYEKHKEIENYKLRGTRPFIGCFHDSIKEATPHLSLTESGAVMKLLLYMKMNSKGLLQKGGEPLKQIDIRKILGKGRTQTAEIVKKLEYLSILVPDRKGRSKLFYMSEEFHIMGKGAGKRYFTKLLTSKLREVVDDLKLEQLGFLYKVLPYFHFDTCVLSHNPNEREEKKILHMNRKELAAAINYDVDNITTLVKQLRKKGLIMTTNSSGNVLYYVHPDLMYRQANDGNLSKYDALRAMFKAHQVNANRRLKTKKVA